MKVRGTWFREYGVHSFEGTRVCSFEDTEEEGQSPTVNR